MNLRPSSFDKGCTRTAYVCRNLQTTFRCKTKLMEDPNSCHRKDILYKTSPVMLTYCNWARLTKIKGWLGETSAQMNPRPITIYKGQLGARLLISYTIIFAKLRWLHETEHNVESRYKYDGAEKLVSNL
ncbi:unnamed protein product [Periconia digitata]|uniref:Uncharacterized protein n=1 Tax=Periconia digitata TaxID=1303443 RepID=A0A9W4URM5_9PLEO|nr:unnamed protein product [Periconia digitata]